MFRFSTRKSAQLLWMPLQCPMQCPSLLDHRYYFRLAYSEGWVDFQNNHYSSLHLLQFDHMRNRCRLLDEENQKLMRTQTHIVQDANRRVGVNSSILKKKKKTPHEMYFLIKVQKFLSCRQRKSSRTVFTFSNLRKFCFSILSFSLILWLPHSRYHQSLARSFSSFRRDGRFVWVVRLAALASDGLFLRIAFHESTSFDQILSNLHWNFKSPQKLCILFI